MRAFVYLLLGFFWQASAEPLDPDWPSWTVQEQCEYCTDFGMGMVCTFKELQGLSKLFVESLDNMANANEVDGYIECQLMGRYEPQKKTFLKNYQEKYRPYIAESSRAFGVPPQLLQCTLLRESYFDENIDVTREKQFEKQIANLPEKEREEKRAQFAKAAKGLCQINAVTAEHINDIVLAGSAVGENPQSMTDRKNKIHWDNWNKYFTELKSLEMYKSDVPKDFSHELGTQIPQNCIGAAGLYFNDMLFQISAKLGVGDVGEVLEFATDGENKDATINLMLVLGAAYNMGPGAASKILKSLDNPTTLSAMVAELQKHAPRETRHYMESLRSCMTSRNFDAPRGWYEEHPENAPQCEEQKQKLQNGDYGTHNLLDHWQ